MKFTDRVPAKPNRRKFIFDDTTLGTKYATVEYADEPTTTGTVLNANNLNLITNDIINQINQSPVAIVRDVDGTVIIDETNIFEGDKISCGDIKISQTASTKEITNNIKITKYNGWLFGLKIGQSSLITSNSSTSCSISIDVNNTSYTHFSSAFNMKTTLLSDAYFPSMYISYLQMYDFNDDVNITYKLNCSTSGSSVTAKGVYIIPLYIHEKRVVLKGAE